MITVEMLMNAIGGDEKLEWRDRNLLDSHMISYIKPYWIVKEIWTDSGYLCIQVDADFTQHTE